MNLKYTLSDIRKVAQVLLAASVKSTFPAAKLAGGGVTPLGFYYDFIFPFEFQAPFFVLIEEGMNRLIKLKKDFVIKEMVPFSAKEMLSHFQEPFLASDLEHSDRTLVRVVQIDSYLDLMQEDDLHLSNTGCVGAVKLKSFEKVGAREGQAVTRIWGAASFDKQSLKDFLKQEKNLLLSLHPQIAKDLHLFAPMQESEGAWIWYPKGEALFSQLTAFLAKNLANEKFQFVKLPSQDVLLGHDLIEHKGLSPESLHVRARCARECQNSFIAEEAVFYDEELSDFSCGLLKTLESTVDIQYIFCSEKQVFDRSISSLHFISKMLKILGFEFKINFSVRKGRPSTLTTERKLYIDAITAAVATLGAQAVTEYTHPTFKGLRVEWKVRDLLGRDWTTGFLQIPFDEEKESVIITSILGSRERILALLLERHKGIPFLLAEEQVKILLVDDRAGAFASDVKRSLEEIGFRVSLKRSDEKENESFRKRFLEKNQFLLILGEKETDLSMMRVRDPLSRSDEFLTLDKLILRLNRHLELESSSELQN